ncbi:unannotated protein [freshwater metagenome]|uniref:Unannotated protein n=1 Tax=freshwater metagenome TaxID=449393 RepID=A0A6J7D7H4_9ZZZZ
MANSDDVTDALVAAGGSRVIDCVSLNVRSSTVTAMSTCTHPAGEIPQQARAAGRP